MTKLAVSRRTGPPRPFQDKQLFVHGHSYTTIPGAKCTANLEYPTALKNRLNMKSVTSYGVSGTRIIDTAQAINSNVSTNTTFAGHTILANSNWPTSRRGIAVIDTNVNDNINRSDMTGLIPVAITSAGQLGIQLEYRAALAGISASQRIEESAGTKTGVWTTSTNALFSGGSTAYTTVNAAKIDFSVTIGTADSGVLYALLIVWDPNTTGGLTSAGMQISIDGSVDQTLTQSQLTFAGFKVDNTPTYQTYSLAAVRIPGSGSLAAGAHTITLTHNDTAGRYLQVDALLAMAASPCPVLVLQDPTPVSYSGSTYTSAQVSTIAANKAIIDPLVQGVVGEFTNALWVPTSLQASDLGSSADGLHPNDRGMRKRADEIEAAARPWLLQNDFDRMYETL